MLLAKWLAGLGASFLPSALKFKLKFKDLSTHVWLNEDPYCSDFANLYISSKDPKIQALFVQCCPDTE